MKPELSKGIIPDTPREVLCWRAQTGADYLDEIWDGFYHVSPEKDAVQHSLEAALECWLMKSWGPRDQGRVFREVRIGRPNKFEVDYRVPALCLVCDCPNEVLRDGYLTVKPNVVIEIVHPGSFAHDKLDFFAQIGVQEVWLIDRDSRKVDLFGCEGRRFIPPLCAWESQIVSPVTGVRIGNQNRELTLGFEFSDVQEVIFTANDANVFRSPNLPR